MHEFDRATHVELLPTGRYVATTSPRFWNAYGPFGGTTAAAVVRALLYGMRPDEQVATLTLHYLDSLAPRPFEIAITHERRTSSLVFARVEVHQEERMKLSGLALLSRARPEPPFSEVHPPPGMGDRSLGRWTEGERLASFTREFDYEFVQGVPFSGQEELVSSVWIGLKEARALDLPLLTAYADAAPPVLWAAQTRPTVFSTVTMSVFFRVGPRELANFGEADRVFAHLRSSLGTGGLIDERQDIWSASGVLLCQTVQVCRYTSRSPEHEALAGYHLPGGSVPPSSVR